MRIDGGMMTASTADTAVIAIENERSYPSFTCASMKILPWLAASAVEEPEIPAKNTDRSTLICASAPGKFPTIVRDSVTRRSVMPPTFIRFAVSKKNGTASRMNELYALNVVLNTTMGESRGSMNSTGRQASPSAKATGTRSTMSRKNVPKSHMAATAGVSAAPVIEGPPRAPVKRAASRSWNTPFADSYHAPRADVAVRRLARRAWSFDERAQIVAQPLEAEQKPRESGERPCGEDPRHRQVGELGALVPPELHE